MANTKKEKAPTQPLILNAIYPINDAQKALGVGRRTVDRFKREGLKVKRAGNKFFVLSNDIWEAMEVVTPSARSKSNPTT